MDIVPTPLPVPTFQATGDPSPAHLLEFLETLSGDLDRRPVRPNSQSNEVLSWTHLVSGLADHFLAYFPTPQELPWSAIHEKIKLTDISLRLIHRATERVELLFISSNDLAQNVFSRLLNLCYVLDIWVDVTVPKEDGYPSPEELQRKAVHTIVAVLRSLGGRLNVGSTKKTLLAHKTLKETLSECLACCNDILSLSSATEYPLYINLFMVPRIREFRKDNPPADRSSVTIGRASYLPLFLSLLIETCIRTIFPTVNSHWYLSDIVRRTLEVTRRAFHFLLSPCSTINLRRARVLERLCFATATATSVFADYEEALEPIWARLLHYRLSIGPNLAWQRLDLALEKVFESRLLNCPIDADLQPLLTLLRMESWDVAGNGLRALGQSYLRLCVPYLGEDNLQMMQAMLGKDGKAKFYAGLLGAVKDRLALLHATNEVVHEHPRDDNDVKSSWRSLLKVTVQAIVEPDELAWMDDDKPLTDAQYIARALDEVESRFSRPIYNPSPKARESLAQQLGKLPCVIVHGESSECSAVGNRPGISTVSAYMSVVILLFDGPEEEVTAMVRKAIYTALVRTLRHHASGLGGGRLEHIAEMVGRGMKDKERSVRLSAGKALIELIRIHQTIGSGAWRRTERLFTMLHKLFATAEDRIKETALITLGHIGKIATSEILGQDICCLISQLGQRSPVLKGTAYLQLQALAKQHKKTAYSLVLPYIDQIAPFLVARLCTQPNLLVEACRFLSISPADFILVTLEHTLPHIFVSCDAKVLDAISQETGQKIASLFVKRAHEVLAYVFRLQGPGQTNRVLSFMLKFFQEKARTTTIDITNIVRSCLVPLLAEIVLVLGDDDADQAEAAMQGLKKVERCLTQPRSSARATPPANTSTFLKTYMLGIISHLNDLLQDVQGRRSIECKRKILKSLGPFVTEIGSAVSNIAPQIMATLQTMLGIPQLTDVTLKSWYSFLTILESRDLGPQVGPTSASFVAYWSIFSPHGRDIVKRCLDFIIFDKGEELGSDLDELVNLESIPQLTETHARLTALRRAWNPKDKLKKILDRSASESLTVATQSLNELNSFLLADNEKFIRDLASGDAFDPLVGQILSALLAAACRDGEETEALRILAFDCIGVLGAVDPDRFEIGIKDTNEIMMSNYEDELEAVNFALRLITDVLVGAFRSTSDIKYQSHLAFAIQELLRFCKFTPALVTPGSTTSIALKVRSRWNSLPKHVLETVTPLLESRFKLETRLPTILHHPIYPSLKTYREWIQAWTSHLITRASGDRARAVFIVFSAVVRNKDVGVARYLLPHLVLNVLHSGNEDDARNIRSELLSVLEDQIEVDSQSAADKKLFCAQTVFMLMDHLNQWVRAVRRELADSKAGSKRARVVVLAGDAEEQLPRIDSILSSIDQGLMAKAALQCKAYARALMNFERQVVTLRQGNVKGNDLHEHYERLHEIYAHLDEPDGMEGVSTLILSPSLEHQIREHESTGRWTSAQSCWEVRLQYSPDNLDFHLGLLRCLRNLGHYDTLRTHVKGVLTRNPSWESQLVGFQVESEWMVGNWDEVQNLVKNTGSQASSVLLAQILLALRAGDASAISNSLSAARRSLGAPIVAAGAKGYRRSYDAVLDLHLVHEVEIIHHVVANLPSDLPDCREVFDRLSRRLSSRLDSTLPTFRTREPILSMRRTAFGLSCANHQHLRGVIGQSWLASAKIARKAGHWQTAYSAMLQARQCKASFSFMESARLIKASGEPLRALQELENSMRLSGMLDEIDDVIDLTHDNESPKMKAKAQILRARWMNDSDRYEDSFLRKTFQNAVELWPKWESGQFHLGQFQDECFKALPHNDQLNRGTRMNLQTVRCFIKATRYGSKYIYQTVPRLLTLWLDMGEDRNVSTGEIFTRVNAEIARAIKSIPVYKWFTAFPQIVSRVGHSNDDVYEVLSHLISIVIQEYPKQALWLFASVVKSTKIQREQRGKAILEKLRQNQNRNGVPKLINESLHMTEQLLALCDHPVRDEKKNLNMSKDFPGLYRLAPSQLIIPLQESLTASLPPTSSSSDTVHQPFPSDPPTFARFSDEVEIMHSLAKPRKITIQGSDGQTYIFLGKPKDDLRKDARLMDFNAIINKILKSNSESRRRQLHIRTYGVVTLNEECGFIQWVSNTVPVRPVLLKSYGRLNVKSWSAEMNVTFTKIKELPDQEAAQLFVKKILSMFPPVFHEWFIETFPEPSAWFTNRLAYSRTAAVMSMVGFILGLGDRHCENILLDTLTGDVIHVDFNCLFEKGKTLETPERVPFRLTQNIIAGFGVTGVEGPFRIACEVTMQLLRDNKDTLMSVLDAFVHDPLVEWEDEKRRIDREAQRKPANTVRSSVDLRMLAKNALKPIEKKLKGIYTASRDRPEKEISTSNLVQMLIQEASDNANLAKMYPGWAPWH
ncbi:hypothetical protein AcV7_003428 [Taiwanofungus camphoratus]|nr:hypothetical protein AcV7_003428 [Antrodia cinnamomea]